MSEGEFIEPGHEEFMDEGADFGEDTRGSLASVTSSIMKGIEENGRTADEIEYGMPMDEKEMERIDMAHEKYYIVLEKKRFLAPIDPNLQRVLDLGCGTGNLPKPFYRVPPNCQFQVDDITMPWTWQQDRFDFIFLRDLLFSIRDWPTLIQQCYNHVKPGGWVEFESILGVLSCDDGTLPPDSKFREYDKITREAANVYGTPLEDVASFKKWFEEAGFEAVVEKKYKIPTNPWPKDPHLKLIGAFEQQNFLTGIEGMSIRALKALGWSYEEIVVFLAAVKKEIKDKRQHPYYTL
ncbi:hypothetical protein CJF32_00009476 [Rutstroemia sp. NJR-2017a WRK4]|nr:hypothetical protein CJF32_00009476 [Rutstroemia sp. NJR-2017a WRK4]